MQAQQEHHHRHNPAHYLREVEAVCAERGLKLTPLRKRVLELLARAKKPIKAYDLLDNLSAGRARASPTTVYRALDFLTENGFIHKLESVSAYTGCHHPTEKHTVPFFICDRCTSAIEWCDSKAAILLVRQAEQLGFKPAAQTLEVHGICAACSEKRGA